MHYINEPFDLGPTRRLMVCYHEDYNPAPDSWAFGTPEETAEAVEWENERLEDGRFVALGLIVEEQCPHCMHWEHVDSLWGVVVTPDEANDPEGLYHTFIGD